MAQEDFARHVEQLDRRQFLVTAAVAAVAGTIIAAPAAQALEAAGTDPEERPEVDAWNVGLITAHRPELTPAENKLRMGELRADIGNRFGLLQVWGRYVPEAGAEPAEELAFLLRGTVSDSGNLKGFLRKVGRKFDQDAVIWKGEDQDAVLLALKEWPALGLRIGDKKKLGRLRPNQIAQYHALLARGWSGASGRWEELGVWTIPSFFSRQPRRAFV